MYGSVDGTFEDDYLYFLTFPKNQRTGIVNSYNFKYYHFFYSVHKEEFFYDDLASRTILLQCTQYLIVFMTVFLYFKIKKPSLKLFMSI